MQSVLIRSAKPHHRYNVAARSTRAIKSPDHAMCLFEPLLPHLPAAPPLTHPVGECSPTDPQTRRGPCTGTVSVRWCRRWLHTAAQEGGHRDAAPAHAGEQNVMSLLATVGVLDLIMRPLNLIPNHPQR